MNVGRTKIKRYHPVTHAIFMSNFIWQNTMNNAVEAVAFEHSVIHLW